MLPELVIASLVVRLYNRLRCIESVFRTRTIRPSIGQRSCAGCGTRTPSGQCNGQLLRIGRVPCVGAELRLDRIIAVFCTVGDLADADLVLELAVGIGGSLALDQRRCNRLPIPGVSILTRLRHLGVCYRLAILLDSEYDPPFDTCHFHRLAIRKSRGLILYYFRFLRNLSLHCHLGTVLATTRLLSTVAIWIVPTERIVPDIAVQIEALRVAHCRVRNGLSLSSPVGPKVSPDVAAVPSGSYIGAIVQFQQTPGSYENNLVKQLGGVSVAALSSINSLVVVLPSASVSQLAGNSDVKYVSLDRPIKAHQAASSSSTPSSGGGEAVSITAPDYTTQPINAPAVWTQGYIGTGIGVAVIDSGIQPLPDLSPIPPAALQSLGIAPPKGPAPTYPKIPGEPAPGANGRILYSENFVLGENDALDHFGHGTHVSGLIGGNGQKSYGGPYTRTFFGAAPNVNLIDLRVLDENGQGTDSSVIAAIERAIQLKSTFNIRVINLSLGRPIYESYTQDPLCQAVEQAYQAGIVVVVAAGNDGRDQNLNSEGYGTINAPGNDPYVITVGAMRTMETPAIQDDLIASYSSKGPSLGDNVIKPDVVAPGNLVISLQYPKDPLAVENPTWITPMSFYQNVNGPASTQASHDYFPLSGTSMATGVASGAIADLLQAQPTLTPDQVKAIVMTSADRSYFRRPASSPTKASPISLTTTSSPSALATLTSTQLSPPPGPT